MKLVRFGLQGSEKPGIMDQEGRIRDLSSVVPDITGSTLDKASLTRIRQANITNLPVAPDGVRLGACVGDVHNFIAVGLNYRDHAAETGAAIPSEPILFNKAPSCVVGPNDTVRIPRGSTKLDWEVELAVIVGETCSYAEERDALSYIAGACICNDISERTFQIERGGTWTKGKGCPTFGPLGPWLVTLDEIPDLQNLGMRLDVNDTRMQTGSTRTMIFSVAHVVHYISQFMILEPGDVITTGTPPGVGMGKNPPVYLKDGDWMELSIDALGTQRQLVAI
jgi:2-keto-4-pentenoate hydratase/2-oxohepta-3-ene-1,7-dioic acid hydratase in catechol pathway